MSAPSIVDSSNLQRGKLQLRWRGSDGGGQGRGGDIVLGPKMLLFTPSLLLLVLGPLNLQGKIFHRHHVPHHLNLKESTRLLPLSKSKNSPPHTQTNFDRTSEEMDRPTGRNYDPNQQRDKPSGAAKTNLINSEVDGEYKQEVILLKRHGKVRPVLVAAQDSHSVVFLDPLRYPHSTGA